MIDLHAIRYVRLGTADLDESIRFATEMVGLELVERSRDFAYVRGDDRDHNICYVAGQPGVHQTGFELRTREELDAAATFLDGKGVRIRVGSREECELRRVQDFIAFKDPTGNEIELVWRPAHAGKRYFPSRDNGVYEFSHIGIRTINGRVDEAFWTNLLNAKVSDWIGEAALLRIDEIHHRLALFPSTYPGVQHVNFQVQGIDDIMRSFYFLTGHNVKIVFGPGRHPTSGAMFLYFQGPDGMVYEYSTGVRSITDPGYQPRSFPVAPSSFCMWGSKPDIPEFKTK